MGFLDTLLGRTKPVQPNLDVLFQLPSAAVTLEAATGFKPTGSGSVCFRPVEGKAFADVEKDVAALTARTGLAVMVRGTRSPEEHRRAAVILYYVGTIVAGLYLYLWVGAYDLYPYVLPVFGYFVGSSPAA